MGRTSILRSVMKAGLFLMASPISCALVASPSARMMADFLSCSAFSTCAHAQKRPLCHCPTDIPCASTEQAAATSRDLSSKESTYERVLRDVLAAAPQRFALCATYHKARPLRVLGGHLLRLNGRRVLAAECQLDDNHNSSTSDKPVA